MCNGASCTPIPVGRIGEIALIPVQVGVNPGRTRIGVVHLRAFMGPVPVALSLPPERLQSPVESWWGLGLGERGSKLLKGQVSLLARVVLRPMRLRAPT